MTLDQLLSKAFNGKAENIVISKNIIMFHLDGVETRINLVSFIDQIYNDHEEQLKAKDEEIERLKEHITHLQNVYMKLDGKYLKLKTELEELKDNQ